MTNKNTFPTDLLPFALDGLLAQRQRLESNIEFVRKQLGKIPRMFVIHPGQSVKREKRKIRQLTETERLMKSARTFLARYKGEKKKSPQTALKRANTFLTKWENRNDLTEDLRFKEKTLFNRAVRIAKSLQSASSAGKVTPIREEEAAA